MKVRDILDREGCIDVYDDVCEALAIAFEGPTTLTPAGEERFREVLDFPVTLGDDCITVHVDDEDEREFMRKLALAKDFFESMAGWCTEEEWDLWFE